MLMCTNRVDDLAAIALANDREAETAARLAEIEAEAARKKEEIELEQQRIRNGGYTDAFVKWGREFLAAVDAQHAKDDRTGAIMAGVESALKNE